MNYLPWYSWIKAIPNSIITIARRYPYKRMSRIKKGYEVFISQFYCYHFILTAPLPRIISDFRLHHIINAARHFAVILLPVAARQPEMVKGANGVIPDEGMEVHSPLLLNRIPSQPSAQPWREVAVVVVRQPGARVEELRGEADARGGGAQGLAEGCVGALPQLLPVPAGRLHDAPVRVVEEIRCPVGVRGGEDDVRPDVGRLPGVAPDDRVAVQPVQLLDAPEAVVDVMRLRDQGAARVHAPLDAASHVVVFEDQAVAALVGLGQAVLAVPELRPAACRVRGAVGHAAVQVIGEGQRRAVHRGGRVLVEDVGDVGPRHARLGGGNYGLFSEHSNFPLTLFLL